MEAMYRGRLQEAHSILLLADSWTKARGGGLPHKVRLGLRGLVLNALAALFRRRNMPHAAMGLLARARAEREEGETMPFDSATQLCLAVSSFDLRQYKRAFDTTQTAIVSLLAKAKDPDADQPQSLATATELVVGYLNLAACGVQLSRRDDAQRALSEARRIATTVLWPHHPLAVATATALATLLTTDLATPLPPPPNPLSLDSPVLQLTAWDEEQALCKLFLQGLRRQGKAKQERPAWCNPGSKSSRESKRVDPRMLYYRTSPGCAEFLVNPEMNGIEPPVSVNVSAPREGRFSTTRSLFHSAKKPTPSPRPSSAKSPATARNPLERPPSMRDIKAYGTPPPQPDFAPDLDGRVATLSLDSPWSPPDSLARYLRSESLLQVRSSNTGLRSSPRRPATAGRARDPSPYDAQTPRRPLSARAATLGSPSTRRPLSAHAATTTRRQVKTSAILTPTRLKDVSSLRPEKGVERWRTG